MLLERDVQLTALRSALTFAGRGDGRLVLVGGEAGVGKSSLVQQIATDPAGLRVLFGVCDGAVPARPLGPLTDIADDLGSPVTERLSGLSDRFELFQVVRSRLVAEPTLFVIEDLHWADEATLDFVRYLGRRLRNQPLLVVITYRDDAVGPDDPLIPVLGDLSSCSTTHRLRVPALSADAVRTWVAATGSAVDPSALYRRTGGNAFFVDEVLKSGGTDVPAGLRDAVLARVGRLSPAGRAVLDAVAVTGPAVGGLVLAAAAEPAAALDECRLAGFIESDGHRVAFRHDLIRTVIEESLSIDARSAVAVGALAWLHHHGDTDHRRLATLAELAGDADALLAHAPQAAHRAAELGAHTEAVQHLRAAVRHCRGLPNAAQARLLDELSYECYLTEHPQEALDRRQQALELYRRETDVVGTGRALRWISRICWMLGRTSDAQDFGAQAVLALHDLPAGRELAMAYSNRSQLCMLAGDVSGASDWGQRAIDLATELSADDVLMHAQNNVGTAIGCAGQLTAGVQLLESSLEPALRLDSQEHVARSFNNLASICISNYALDAAQEYLDAGMSYCAERDLDMWQLSLECEAATADLVTGRWDSALGRCARISGNSRGSAVLRVTALWVRGVIKLRSGLPGATADLSEAHALATRIQDPQSRIPVASARVEAAWAAGKFAAAQTEIDRIWELATRTGQRWWLGELACWSVLAGGRRREMPVTSEPHDLMLSGCWRDAALSWERLGNPFWRAVCLAQSDDPDDARAAHGILTSLNATATMQAAKREWQQRGIPVPRGPRPAGSVDAHGLTARELDVVDLLGEGQSNAQIADRLVVSERTVAHHVSAILRKLRVSSRAQAVVSSRRLGLIGTAGRPAE